MNFTDRKARAVIWRWRGVLNLWLLTRGEGQ